MGHLIQEQKLQDIPIVVILDYLRKTPDYDATKQQPIQGPYVPANLKEGTPLERLEDIDQSWVGNYLQNVLIGFKKRRENSLIEWERENRTAKVFVDNETGETIDEMDNAVEQHEVSMEDLAYAKARLPHILKRIYDKSIKLGVNVMSLIIAYESARMTLSNGEKPTPQNILRNRVFRMKSDGYIGELYNEKSNTNYPFRNALAWISGLQPDSYYWDAMELLNICDILNVDIRKENPCDYQADFIKEMCAEYIGKNKDYPTGPRRLNSCVLEAIASASIHDYNQKEDVMSDEDFAINISQLLLESGDKAVDNLLRGSTSKKDWNKFMNHYAQLHSDFRILARDRYRKLRIYSACDDPTKKLVPMIDDFYLHEGFLCELGSLDNLMLFDMAPYCGESIKAIVHCSGVVFCLEDSFSIKYKRVEEIVKTLSFQTVADYTGWEVCTV